MSNFSRPGELLRACARYIVAFAAAATAQAEAFEFKSMARSARVDNQNLDYLWQVGDVNSNGEIDPDETPSHVVDVGRMFYGAPGTSIHALEPPPQFALARSRNNSTFVTSGYELSDPSRDDTSFFLDNRADFDHLVRLPSVATAMIERKDVRVSGLSVGQSLEFAGTRRLGSEELIESVELSAGVRSFRVSDMYLFELQGGTLGRTRVNSTMLNDSVGPQLGVGWSARMHRLTVAARGSAMVGYSRVEGTQQGVQELDLLPSPYYRGSYFSPTSIAHQRVDNDYVAIAEVGTSLRYDVRNNLALTAGLDYLLIHNVQTASDSVVMQTNFGLIDGGGTDFPLVSGRVGVEWRR